MPAFQTIFILATAFLGVFWEAAFPGFRGLLGAQIDFLPPLMVYTALSSGLGTVSLLAFMAGLWADSLSASPLGISIIPLFAAGIAIYVFRELILRDQTFAQMVLGWAAGVGVPVLTLLALFTAGHTPMVGWGTLWQLVVMGAASALLTPAFFLFFEWLKRMLVHQEMPETSFRSDREIRRGR
jgi:cell shape-determining protein MreD